MTSALPSAAGTLHAGAETPLLQLDDISKRFGGVKALDDVRFHRETQLTSSSPMLVASTPAGRRIIKRGNPFNGGLGDLDAVLTTAVFGPPR